MVPVCTAHRHFDPTTQRLFLPWDDYPRGKGGRVKTPSHVKGSVVVLRDENVLTFDLEDIHRLRAATLRRALVVAGRYDSREDPAVKPVGRDTARHPVVDGVCDCQRGRAGPRRGGSGGSAAGAAGRQQDGGSKTGQASTQLGWHAPRTSQKHGWFLLTVAGRGAAGARRTGSRPRSESPGARPSAGPLPAHQQAPRRSLSRQTLRSVEDRRLTETMGRARHRLQAQRLNDRERGLAVVPGTKVRAYGR